MAENEPEGKPVESFEKCLEELEKVVNELEGGDLTLERSLELFERGMGLSESCRKQLEEAETRVEMLIRKEGKLTAEPFRPDVAEKAGTCASIWPSSRRLWTPNWTAWSRPRPKSRPRSTALCGIACSQAASASVRSCASKRRAPSRTRTTAWHRPRAHSN